MKLIPFNLEKLKAGYECVTRKKGFGRLTNHYIGGDSSIDGDLKRDDKL